MTILEDFLQPYTERRKASERSESDPWVVVGSTTIDGTRLQVASAFGCKPHGLGPTLAQAQGFAHAVGGRMLRVVNYDLDDSSSVVYCDIVRRQSEIDAEHKTHIDFVSKWAADPWRIRPTVMRQECHECGPHGNTGRVLLLETMVDCTTCRRPSTCQSGQCTGREEDGWCPQCDQASIDSMSTEVADVDKAMTNLAFVKTGVDEDGRTVWKRLVGAPEDEFSIPAAGDKVRTKDGTLCSVERIHENEPRLLLSDANGNLIGWRSTDDVKAVHPTPTAIESRAYLGHTLKTFTPPPILITIADIRAGLKMPCLASCSSLHDLCIRHGAKACSVWVDGDTMTMVVEMQAGVDMEEMKRHVLDSLHVADGKTYVFHEVG